MASDEKRKRHADYMREYTRKNRDRINAQRRAKRAENRDAILARERAWKADNHDKVLGYKKRDREKRPEDYARWKRDWESRNVEKVRARKKADYEMNKDAINARLEKHRRENPERFRLQRVLSSQRRRARLASVPQEEIDRDTLYERDGGVCGICGKEVGRDEISIDHIVPLSKGGPHLMDNLQIAHLNCNKARGNHGPTIPVQLGMELYANA